MEDKYRQILQSCDEKGAYEFPQGFNYDTLERDALGVERSLQEQLQLKTNFEGAVFNQDASFSIAIILTGYVEERKDAIYQPTIRFSNFGRLVTLTWTDMLPESLPDRIRLVLEAHGFHFIPAVALDTNYDGVMADDNAFPTWWTRYFDWL